VAIKLEIVCASAEDCGAAEQGGADRIELVSAIEMGGLTPSVGTYRAARKMCSLPMIVMLRPRTGGFCFTDGEFSAMKEDAAAFEGASGFVSGILLPDARVDEERCRELIDVAPGAEWVFHRAFDVTPDPFEALECLIRLGFRRLLTSGQRATVEEGAGMIRELVKVAAGRIEILPGSGINAENVARLVAELGVDQVHSTAFETAVDLSTEGAAIPFNGREVFESGFRAASAAGVSGIRTALG
jgi:copper homeostasis protein